MAATGYGQSGDISRVAKAGDTMIGPLILTGNPAMQASAGASAGDVWTSDDSGNGSWQPAGSHSGALLVVNNLSDLLSTSAARASLGLSGAAVISLPVSVANGGTGSSAQNFVDLSNPQTVDGVKTFLAAPVVPTSAFPQSAVSGLSASLAARLQASNNLSDLASAGTARTSLGLGNSAVKNVGTTAGTVAAGDDSRFAGSIPASAFTAKGDLLSASGAGVVQRLGVGSDAQVLTADSTTLTGLKWAPTGSASFRGTWSSSASYSTGDITVLNNRSYQATSASTGVSPLLSTQFISATPATVDSGDGAPYEMGMKFTPSVDLRLTGVAFYKTSANTGTHVGRIWQLGANSVYYKVNEATFSGESASGWQTVALAADLAAGSTYVVSCAFPNGHYSFDTHYFDSPVTVGSVVAPVAAGMFSTTLGNVPNVASNNASYAVAPVWGEPVPAQWQELGDFQNLHAFPSAQESAAAYVLSQIGAPGGIGGLDGFSHTASTGSGTATIASGSTSVATAHGMSRTPTLRQIAVTPTNDMGAATKFWVSAVDATNITINVDAAPTSSAATFAWQVNNV